MIICRIEEGDLPFNTTMLRERTPLHQILSGLSPEIRFKIKMINIFRVE